VQQLTPAACDGLRRLPACQVGDELAVGRIDIIDVADVAVIDFLVVIVIDLHDLVAWGEGPVEAFDLAIAGRIERGLQARAFMAKN
jgi:hypothetical protein